MHSTIKTPNRSQAEYESIIEMPSHFSIEAAAEQAARELYGASRYTGKGQWRRFTPEGASSQSGYIGLLGDSTAVVGDWRETQRLVVLVDSDDDDITRSEKRQQARMEAQRQRDKWEAERLAKQAETAKQARQWWASAKPADPLHPYLVKKQLRPYGLRQRGNALLVPLFIDGELINLERIFPDGAKRPLPAGRVKGAASLVGRIAGAERVLVAEGWATGAALYATTGCPVVIARNAANLEPVARRLRQRLPEDVTITIAADDDRFTEGNPGMNKARIASLAIGGKLLTPTFCGRCESCTDFADVALCRKGAA